MKSRKTSCLLSVLVLLTLASCKSGVHDNGDTLSHTARVILHGNEIPSDYTLHERNRTFLDYHDLNSFYFAEIKHGLPDDAFRAAAKELVPGNEYHKITDDTFYISIYSIHEPANHLALSSENIFGLSITSFGESGFNHYYYKKNGDTFEREEQLDDTTTELYSSREHTLLHYASFPSAPATSGIIVLRKQLDPEQISRTRTWTKALANNKLIDAIYSDSELNIGVAYLDNKPDAGIGCGGACSKVPSCSTSSCKCVTELDDFDKLKSRCEPIGKTGSCLGHSAMELSATSRLGFEIDIPKFRDFDDNYLVKHKLGRQYLEYIPILDRNLELDFVSLTMYMEIFPDLYRMMDMLMGAQVDDSPVVITNELVDKAIGILDRYNYVDDPNFQAMSATMRRDLLATKGMSKAELEIWIGKHE